MKVRCDVCKGGEEEASVYCCADEAALCGPCDARVHGANKLAGKHPRYALHPADSPRQLPLCDICKHKRAFLFCQEDRAILCGDCDAPIHDANELTRKHSRFLLTGIKLSPSCAAAAAAAAPEVTSSSDSGRPSSVVASTATTATSADGEEFPAVSHIVNHGRRHGAHGFPKQHETPAAGGIRMTTYKKSKEAEAVSTGFSEGKVAAVAENIKGPRTSTSAATGTGGGGRSISEYLTKELPGWHFEDLLLDSSCWTQLHPATFVDSITPFREPDLDAAAVAAGPTFLSDVGGKLPAWCVPQVPQLPPALPAPPPAHDCQPRQQQGMAMMGLMAGELAELPRHQHHHQYHHWTADDGFTVPDLIAIHHNPPPHKRPRQSSWRISY